MAKWSSRTRNQLQKEKASWIRKIKKHTGKFTVSETVLFQYFWLVTKVTNDVSALSRKHEATHTRKLHRLGIASDIVPCNPDTVIFNLSSKDIPTRIKLLLAFGLEFKLPVCKLNFYDYFLCFEKLIRSISTLPLPPRFKFQDVKQRIRTIAYNYYYGFLSSKVFSPVFSKSDVKLLK